ncbi:MAG: DnaA regulatory inactivator Hda [Candidatus Eutrophobiaceae bacterium]
MLKSDRQPPLPDSAARAMRQLPFCFAGRVSVSLESFHGISNELPRTAVHDCIHSVKWGMLYIWGAASSGKTHLLRAACNEARQCSRTSIYVDLAEHVGGDPTLLEGLEGLNAVCLDNLPCIAGDAAWERAAMLLYEGLRQARHSLLVAANAPSAAFAWSLPDLRTRLEWGLTLRIQELGDEEKICAMQQRARFCSLELPEEVARYMMQRVSRDTRYLFNLIEEIDIRSLSEQRRVTIPFVRAIIANRQSL